MKPKILEIAKKAGLQYGFSWEMESFSIDKFAKLIIQECHRASENYINECGEVNGVPESVFKSHFGIEE